MTNTQTHQGGIQQDVMNVVDRAELVGLRPEACLSLCTCTHADAGTSVAPPTPQEWREAILSTLPGGDFS